MVLFTVEPTGFVCRAEVRRERKRGVKVTPGLWAE